eukprot:2065586-Pyramimonas_sp.AAC.1
MSDSDVTTCINRACAARNRSPQPMRRAKSRDGSSFPSQQRGMGPALVLRRLRVRIVAHGVRERVR